MFRGSLVACGVVVVAGLCLAPQAFGKVIPVANWPVPDDAGLVVSALDLSNPVPFIPVTPCRVADTRGNGFSGEWGPPNLTPNQYRDFTIGGQCGIPANAKAVSFNFTVVSTGTGAGFLRVYPAGGTVPVVSTLNWVQWETKANAAVVPLNGSGDITVNTSAGGAAVIIDVNGYFGDTPAVGGFLDLYTNTEIMGLRVVNSSPTCSGTCGAAVVTHTATAGAATSLYVVAYGSGAGERTGVHGFVGTTTNGSAGVKGENGNSSGKTYGVLGTTASTDNDTAGVLGQDGAGINKQETNWFSAGVRGEGKNGVVGVSSTTIGRGAVGHYLDPSTGATVSFGYLGSATYGVYASGNMGASGTKSFVEPHPTEADAVIRYVSLEGPEAGTYFRGKGMFVGRSAFIEVPETFRIVTDPEGLSIQVTPIGDFASVAVVSLGLDRIELKATRDVEFYYTVNGVRRAYKDWQVVVKGDEYRPRSAEDTMPAYLSEEAKRRLIANGTYHEDGTVNLETAERLGWVAAWREDEARSRAASEAASRRLRMQAEGADRVKP